MLFADSGSLVVHSSAASRVTPVQSSHRTEKPIFKSRFTFAARLLAGLRVYQVLEGTDSVNKSPLQPEASAKPLSIRCCAGLCCGPVLVLYMVLLRGKSSRGFWSLGK